MKSISIGVKTPNAYTFDPAVIGFSALDLERGASLGLDLRTGYLLKKLMIYGSLGYSHNKQTVLIDGTPLDQFSGGSGPVSFRSHAHGPRPSSTTFLIPISSFLI